MRSDLPAGTVTFLFTDVEGSTRLLHELGEEAYAEALAEHRLVLRATFARHGGVEVDTQGDAFFYAFPTAAGALHAASEGQEALAAGPIRVRLGLHTGSPLLTEEGYVGHDVHFAARVAACGHGGQVLLSKETASLVDSAPLTSLGSHRLKDVSEPVTVYQLGERAFPRLKTVANSNLPTPASSFLGREEELYEADRLLQETRMLTITGPGGAGKTRFALELATRAREERFSDYEDGIYSAFLSSLRDPQLVPATIAVSLNVREQPGQSVAEALSSHLQGKRLLLLLDNLEHLLETAPELSELVQACPGLTLLCTSRARLRLQGERVYELPPLREAESVSLFCERAQTEPDDATHDLCARLEGLPLAIELAAARTSVLTPQQISTRLSQRLDFLKGGPDRDPRQETLRATIEWSYELLPPEEQTLLARLAVFAGGCTLEAAEDVCDADVDTLQSLVDKSLLRFTDGRYWLLETIREYAAERLEVSGTVEEANRRHARWVLELASERDATFGSTEEHQRFVAEEDNFRGALAWAEHAGDTELQLELIGRNWPFWWYRGHATEGLEWVDSALSGSADERTNRRKQVLDAGAMFAYRSGALDLMETYANESLEIARGLGDRRGTAWPLVFLGLGANEAGDYAGAKRFYERAVVVANEVANRALVGIVNNNLGVVATLEGDLASAISYAEKALAIAEELDTPDETALYTVNLADSLYRAGRSPEAARVAKQGLRLARESENFMAVEGSFVVLAAASSEEGRPATSARLLGAAAMIRDRSSGGHSEVADRGILDATSARIVEVIGLERYNEAFAEGARMTLDDAIDYALEEPSAGERGVAGDE